MFLKKKENIIADGYQTMENFLNHHLPKRKKKKPLLKRAFVVSLIILLVLIIILAPVGVQGFLILQKAKVIEARAGNVMQLVKASNWTEVKSELAQTKEDLNYIKARLHRLGLISYVPQVSQKINVADHLITASVDLLSGYGEALSVMDSIKSVSDINTVAQGLSGSGSKKDILMAISQNKDAFQRMGVYLAKAKADLSEISADDLSGKWASKLATLNFMLNEAISGTQEAMPILIHSPELLGADSEKTYLLVFQNNMEMRATGGFIGSYGLITVKEGEITNLFTDDVYNLDKYSKDKLNAPAPEPIAKYLKQKYWFMRDANWSPDWPTSARQILWFFNAERSMAGLPPQKVDGVIAISPDLIANTLALVGSIDVDGNKFDSNNFALSLEKFVESDYADQGIAVHERKSIMGPMAKIIFERIQQMPPSQLLNLWNVFKKDIDQKQVLVYLLNNDLQSYFADHNWSGAVKQTDGDFLMVIDSNLAALKTDVVMKKSINYNVGVDDNGNLISTASISLQHNGKYTKDLISMYRDYIRVYVPQGVKIKKISVVEDKSIKNLQMIKDVDVGEELGKEYVGTFLTVEQGKTKTLVIEYQLPENLQNQYQNGVYKLFVQKQPGTSGHSLSVGLNFNKNITAYQFDSLPSKLRGGSINWQTDLTLDRSFSLKL